MIGALRIAGIGAAGLAVWVVSAAGVAGARPALASLVPGAVMTQPFGCTSLVLEPPDSSCPGGHFHSGIDLAATTGTPVHSATTGVAAVGFDPGGAGLFVAVTGGGARLLYCHLSAALVADGESVVAGQTLGEVGATGDATGPHLHFEVQVTGRAIDPAKWLDAQGAS